MKKATNPAALMGSRGGKARWRGHSAKAKSAAMKRLAVAGWEKRKAKK